MTRRIIKLIKDNLIDIEIDDLAQWGKNIHDVADKLFDVDKKAMSYTKEYVVDRPLEWIKDNFLSLNGTTDALDNIDAISKMDYSFIYQHGWSNRAKEVFAPFHSEETSSQVMDYIQNENYNVSFTGICNSSDIDLDLGIIDFADGADLATNISDSSDFLDFVELGGDALDLSDAATTFGLSLLASWLVKKGFQSAHDEKKNEIHILSEKISPKMKLLSCIKNNVCTEEAYPIYQSFIKR